MRLINVERMDPGEQMVELPNVTADRPAYILYTSGSTGRPKGVIQNHRNVLHFIRVYANNLHINSTDRLTLLSSYCFDASVMDIYGALLNGATLYPIDIKRNGFAGLSEHVSNESITIYHSTPTVYRYFVETLTEPNGFPRLRLIVLGGEEVSRRDVELYGKHFSDDCILVNGLGPTESTVSLQNFIDKRTVDANESVPVGFAVENTEVLLLSDAGKPVEIQGEIAIKSQHVALGYWRNPEATSAAFIGPVNDGRAWRTYKTGDLGRRLPDGSIRFEGRKDFQIKIRGFRVEAGEIETVLCQHPLVRESVVVARESEGRERLLVAYVVRQTDQSPTESELRSFLKKQLPEYMLPSAFVGIDALPLTESGKVNRRALPAPVHVDRKPPGATSTPQTALERLLLPIWSEVLGVPVRVTDNFFECGGHSLLAVRLFAQIEKRLGHHLALATLFQAPTVAQLAAVIDVASTHEWTSLVPIQIAGDLPPFFCVHGLGGHVLEFYDLARHLGPNQPFYGLQSRGLDGKQPLHTSV
ncbi:MAG: AMP-binding protein, partial [Acidobacteriota bacterium]